MYIGPLIEQNMFNHITYLIQEVYDEEKLKDIVPIIRRYVTKVRSEQDNVIDLANNK